MTPKTTEISVAATHRLIPSKYGDSSPLAALADDAVELAAVLDLDGATDGRRWAETGHGRGITPEELVFDIPRHSIINGAFTHPRPTGGRFNSDARGAWYAAFEIETAIAEAAYHRTRGLAEIDRFEDDVSFDDWLAAFDATFHDIRVDPNFAACCDPGDYRAGQNLAADLLDAGSAGVLYTSVRRSGFDNLVCFRPALVHNPRKGETIRLVWAGDPAPQVVRG